MFRKESSIRVDRETSSSPVSRYQALQNEDGSLSEQELDLAEDSVDFRSVLGAVASVPPEKEVPGEAGAAGQGQKDLNISSVISRIQDEGPAMPDGSSGHSRPIEEVKPNDRGNGTESDGLPEDDSETGAGRGQQSSLAKEDIVQLARATAEAALVSRTMQEERKAGGKVGWLFSMVLLCLLAVGGYVLYETSTELRLARAGISQLSSRLLEVEEMLGGLRRQVSGNSDRIQGLYAPEQLQAELAAHRQDLYREMENRLAVMYLTAIPPAVTSGRKAQPKEKTAGVKARDRDLPLSSRLPLEQKVLEDQPVSPREREWNVYLSSHVSESRAKKMLDSYRNKIPDVAIQTARVKGKTVYRITVPGFASKQEAVSYLAEIRGKLGLKGSWVGRQKVRG